tara:strand:- start:279 stop:563 length:285 start_codon:yes stop_codon:yes gene_type:complete
MNCGCGQNPCKTYGSKKNNDMKKMTNPFAGSNNVGGLYVKNGRLINERMEGETGIAQAARFRKQMEKQYKIDCIADGIERAKMRMDNDKDIYEF